jgi:hypothetical protein
MAAIKTRDFLYEASASGLIRLSPSRDRTSSPQAAADMQSNAADFMTRRGCLR